MTLFLNISVMKITEHVFTFMIFFNKKKKKQLSVFHRSKEIVVKSQECHSEQ